MLRLVLAAASLMLASTPASAIPLVGGPLTLHRYIGAITEGETDAWDGNGYLPYSILHGICYFVFTPYQLRFEGLLYSKTDVIVLRILMTEGYNVVYREFEITGASPVFELQYTSNDSCPHFWVTGKQVNHLFLYDVEVTPST